MAEAQTDRWPTLPPAALPDDVAKLLDREGGAAPSQRYAGAITAAWERAPYLKRLMRTRPMALARIVGEGPEAAVAAAHAVARGEGKVDGRLRDAKAELALAVALADLAGEWPLERVTAALSDFADLALSEAIAAAIGERVEGAEAIGLTALALGKLGSRELNYSSDVDLILLHDRKTLPRRERDDPDESAVRIGRRVVEIMQKVDGGYVFRVDLRLRPSPEATAIVLPVEAAESYYQSEALTWERAAFIRARAAAGDIAMGRSFLDAIRPFVWRRSLDYTAIRDIQAVSLRIRDHYAAGQEAGPGFDLKRGRGGIREVEFFAQIHQLIFGGREPGLRAPATLDALAALSAAGRIGAEDAAALASAYCFHRTAEHRVQMRDDEQTHRIPETADARAALAAFSGYRDWEAFERELVGHASAVAARYDVVIAEARGETPAPAVLSDHLAERGLPDSIGLAGLVEGWRSGKYRSLRSEAARGALEAILPGLIDGIAASVDPKAAATRLDTFLAQLPTGAQFLALLAAHPKLVDLLGHLLGTTPTLADALARSPELFDVVLDPLAFAVLPDRDGLAAELRLRIADAPLEEALDRTRRWTAERRFQIGMQLIEDITDPLQAARSYSDLADAAFAVLTPVVEAAFAEAHGHVPGGAMLVLGFGRFGGSALTAKSDLDIVYLFTGDHGTESDGARPLGASVYFNRLAQRVTAAMSVPTAAGALYEIDTRLRPSGAQGMLAVTIDSFADYQRKEAWTWEHMALTRARVVVGDAPAVEAVIVEVLNQPRDPAKLKADVLAMRTEMAAHKPPTGPWDVKLARGGLVDLEFIVHYLQLRDRTAFTPDLRAACEALGLPELVAADDLMTRMLVMLRLLAPDGKVPEAVGLLLARSCRVADLKALEAALALAKRQVLAAWETAFGEPRKGKG